MLHFPRHHQLLLHLTPFLLPSPSVLHTGSSTKLCPCLPHGEWSQGALLLTSGLQLCPPDTASAPGPQHVTGASLLLPAPLSRVSFFPAGGLVSRPPRSTRCRVVMAGGPRRPLGCPGAMLLCLPLLLAIQLQAAASSPRSGHLLNTLSSWLHVLP